VARPEIFPQGPAYVAGALEAAGHQVFGCNMAYALTKSDAPTLLFRALAQSIAECRPDIICLGGLTADYWFIRHAISACRRLVPDTPVVLGGGIVTSDRLFIMAELKPDFSITGDAEIPVVELLAALASGGPLASVQGLGFWRDGEPVFNSPRAESKHLPDYPWPSYDALGIEDFFRSSTHTHAWHLTAYQSRPRVFPISAGRSCPFSCTFCFHSSGSVYKQRPLPDVLAEIAHFHDKYHFNFLLIYDELFSVKEARVRAFCDGIRSLGLDFKWSAALRVPDISTDLLRDMKDAGCAVVGVGLESASDVVLNSMKKKITKAQMTRAVEASVEAGLVLQGNFIFGDPAETEDTMRETAEFARLHDDKMILNVGQIKPFPGSPIFDDGIARGLIKDRLTYYTHPTTYNLTSIPTERYDSLVDQAVSEHISRLLLGTIGPQLFLVYQPGGKFDEFPRSSMVALVTCPHCEAQVDRIQDYPGDVQDIIEGKLDFIREYLGAYTHFVCPECSKQSMFRMQRTNLDFRPISCPPGKVPLHGQLVGMN
jgi:radical SAM superfamily enzyme YgiQ (UPF0313 family)